MTVLDTSKICELSSVSQYVDNQHCGFNLSKCTDYDVIKKTKDAEWGNSSGRDNEEFDLYVLSCQLIKLERLC